MKFFSLFSVVYMVVRVFFKTIKNICSRSIYIVDL